MSNFNEVLAEAIKRVSEDGKPRYVNRSVDNPNQFWQGELGTRNAVRYVAATRAVKYETRVSYA